MISSLVSKSDLPNPIANLEQCRYCSEVSQAVGEDPGGTALPVDHWVLLEIPQPWPKDLFKEQPEIKTLFPLFKDLFLNRGVRIMAMLMAPDPEYSQPGQRRMIYYRRPTAEFAQYQKQEFLVPTDQFTELGKAILLNSGGDPEPLTAFEPYLQDSQQIRELLVCTHTQVDLACGRFGTPLYRRLRKEYVPQAAGALRVWQTSHIDGHQFAPTLVDLPDGHFWGHVTPEVLDTLVWRQGDVASLRPFYRGWSGLKKFEQLVERELLVQHGWAWLTYYKSGQVVSRDRRGFKQFLFRILELLPFKVVKFIVGELSLKASNWATVRLSFRDPQSDKQGVYEAKVQVQGAVTTAIDSAQTKTDKIKLKSVKQYQVSHLTQIK
jgi:hypothetical protein